MNVFLVVACLIAGSPEQPYRVGVAHFPPMIVIDSKTGEIGGSDYDMFEQLADDPDIAWNKDDYEYVVVNSFDKLISQVESGEVDIAIAGISITHDRLRRMHFSQPYKNSGQRIMTSPREDKSSVWAYLARFMRTELLFSFVALGANFFIWGIILTFVERSFHPRQMPSSTGTKDTVHTSGTELPNITNIEQGTLAAFDAGTTIGYGRYYPVTRVGQLVIVVAFFCGTVIIGDVISTLTTNRIVNRLEGEISGPQDLKGKIVAVVDGTTSEKLVGEYSPAQVLKCDDFYKAVVEMRLGNAEAVVADNPVIQHYVKENPAHASTAGSKFHAEDYGIVFTADVNRDLVTKFSIAIARLRESGKLALIESRWYGE